MHWEYLSLTAVNQSRVHWSSAFENVLKALKYRNVRLLINVSGSNLRFNPDKIGLNTAVVAVKRWGNETGSNENTDDGDDDDKISTKYHINEIW